MKDELTLLSLKDIKNIKNINGMTDIALLTGGCYYIENRHAYSIDYLSDSEDKLIDLGLVEHYMLTLMIILYHLLIVIKIHYV